MDNKGQRWIAKDRDGWQRIEMDINGQGWIAKDRDG